MNKLSRLLFVAVIGLTLLLLFPVFCRSGPLAVVEGDDSAEFGIYPARERREAVFRLRNDGDAALKIGRIRHSCGCSEAAVEKTELMAGESTAITVTVMPDSIYGSYRRHVFVETSDPERRIVRYTLIGNAVPVAGIIPKNSVYAGRIMPGAEWQHELILEPNQAGVEFGKVTAESNYPVETSLTADGDKYRLKISVTPEDAHGDLKLKVLIPVVKPEGWKPLGVTVSGKVGREFRAMPSKLILAMPGDGEKAVTRSFELRLLGGKTGTLTADKITCPEIDGAAFTFGKPQNGIIPVSAVFGRDFMDRLAEEKRILLRFSMPGAEAAELSCMAR